MRGPRVIAERSHRGALIDNWHEPPGAVPWDPYLVWQDLIGGLNDGRARGPRHPARAEAGKEEAEADQVLLPMPTLLVEIRSLKTLASTLDFPKIQFLEGLPSHPGWSEMVKARPEGAFVCLLLSPQLFGRLLVAATERDVGLLRMELSQPRRAALGVQPDPATPAPPPNPWPTPKQYTELFEKLNLWAAQSGVGSATLPALLLDAQSLGAKAPARLTWKPSVLERPKSPSGRYVACAVIDDLPNFAAWPRDSIASIWVQSPRRERRRRLEPAGHGFQTADQPPEGADPTVVLDTRFVPYGRVRDFRFFPIDAAPGGQCRDEVAEYRRSRFMRRMRRWSHGSAVLSLILHRNPPPQDVHLVQLPVSTVLDTAGGSLASFALDGMLYALERAKQDNSTHLIVNLSFGTHSGPHNGRGTFERALCQLLDHHDGRNGTPQLHVVMPAGNAQRARIHTSFHLTKQLPVREIHWRVLPDNSEPSFIEIWFPHATPDATVTLTSPDGQQAAVRAGQIIQWTNESTDQVTTVHVAQIFGSRVSQSDTGTMLLIALGPTREDVYQLHRVAQQRRQRRLNGRDMGEAPHGVWTIKVVRGPRDPESMLVDAWVQRGDAAPARALDLDGFAGRQSYLLEEQADDIDPQVTLSGAATLVHDRFHVVGAMRQSDLGLATYSASGPARPPSTRFSAADAVMQVDRSVCLPGMLVGGVISSARVRVGGTSMAAAAYTRALCDWLAAYPPRDPMGLKQSAGGVACPTRDPMQTPGDPALASVLLRGECERIPGWVEGPDRDFPSNRQSCGED